jgi:hypothetical protein
MEEEVIKVGDTVNHKFIGTNKDLYVAATNGVIATTRYYWEHQFYTNEFYVNELQISKPKTSNIGALRSF